MLSLVRASQLGDPARMRGIGMFTTKRLAALLIGIITLGAAAGLASARGGLGGGGGGAATL